MDGCFGAYAILLHYCTIQYLTVAPPAPRCVEDLLALLTEELKQQHRLSPDVSIILLSVLQYQHTHQRP
jgi:hypothetical protein